MLTLVRFLAIFGIASFAINTDTSNALQYGALPKEAVAAALIALLSLPTVIRWSD